MISKTQKETIKKFFEAVENISHGPGEIYDLGLVISDNLKSKDLVKFVPRPKEVEVFNLSGKSNSQKFLKTLATTLEEKRWLLINLEDGYLPSAIYSQLRLLSTNNCLQIFSLDGAGKTDFKMPKESRIVVLANKNSMAKIDNSSFLSLFGPVINI